MEDSLAHAPHFLDRYLNGTPAQRARMDEIIHEIKQQLRQGRTTTQIVQHLMQQPWGNIYTPHLWRTLTRWIRMQPLVPEPRNPRRRAY